MNQEARTHKTWLDQWKILGNFTKVIAWELHFSFKSFCQWPVLDGQLVSQRECQSLSSFVPVDLKFLAAHWPMRGVCQYDVYITFGRCAVLFLWYCKQEMSDKTTARHRQYSILRFAPALNEPLQNNNSWFRWISDQNSKSWSPTSTIKQQHVSPYSSAFFM